LIAAIARRILYAAALCWLLATLLFAITEVAPPAPPPPQRPSGAESGDDFCRERLGTTAMDRYVARMTTVGRSWTPPCAPVTTMMADRLPKSARLAGFAIALAWPLSLLAALTQGAFAGRPIDRVITGGAALLHAWPVFLLGAFAQRAAPSLGLPSVGAGAEGHHLAAVILPGTTLAMLLASSWVRTLRATAVDAFEGPRVRAARARGLSEATVVGRYVLPSVLRPAITLLGLALPRLVGGTLVIEGVFMWTAMGQWLTTAVSERDLPVLTAVTLLVGAMVALGGALTDAANALLRADGEPE